MPRKAKTDQPAARGSEPRLGGFTLPDNLKSAAGAALLLEACNTYGVDPDLTLPVYAGHGAGPFRELMAWKFYPGNEAAGVPDAVNIVTVGGVKVRHYADPDFPMDPDTENRLRGVFHAWKTDPKTNEVVPIPLPDDLTLPRTAVTGQSESTAHTYKGGYLKRAADDPRRG